jgi:hypothetical protein
MFQEGDILLSPDGRLSQILKIDELAPDRRTFHVRLFAGLYSRDEAESALLAGALTTTIMHAPVNGGSYDPARHQVIANVPVTDDDLRGYRAYEHAMQNPSYDPEPDQDMVASVFKGLRATGVALLERFRFPLLNPPQARACR